MEVVTTDDLLRELIAEVRALHTMLRRERASAHEARADLLRAIEGRYGSTPFTTATLLQYADREPHGDIARALGGFVDLGAEGRAVAAGKLLSSMEQIDRQRRGNVLLFSVADRD